MTNETGKTKTAQLRIFFSKPSVLITLALWAAGNLFVLACAQGRLPFDRPAFSGASAGTQLLAGNIALAEVFFLMAIVWLLTRRRPVPKLANRAPARNRAAREVLLLVAYGVLAQLGGVLLGKALGWHPISFHLAGTLYGLDNMVVTPAEALGWMAYNFCLYAVAPYMYFRRRYSGTELSLHSNNWRNDALVVVVVLAVEALFEILGLGLEIFHLNAHQIALGAPLTFGLYFLGTVLPTMIFIYSILLPRYARLTRSLTATVILGGVTYTLLHFFDAWTAYSSFHNGVLSVIFLFLLYFGPGMFKSVVTLRTANAWVHVWAYHAFVPHTLDDTPLIVKVFGIK